MEGTHPFSIAGDFDGGFGSPQPLKDLAKRTVGAHPVVALIVILVLLIIIVYMWWSSRKPEGFNPVQTLRDVSGDQFGLDNARMREGLDNRSQTVKAMQIPGGGAINFDANASVNQPGSLGWHILNSKEFDCANRKDVTNDAWGWQIGVAKESAHGDKSDNKFSKVMAGY